MKKVLSFLLAFVLLFSLCSGLISCGNTNNPSDEDNPSASNPGDKPSTSNPSEDKPTSEPFIVDLEGYVANIGTATALGISRKAKASVSPMAFYGTNNSGVQLLSFNTLAYDNDTEDKNYIVMSTTEYDANAPEADETGLTKVTFTKIVTENVTTEITGTKHIIATEGAISIATASGFKYSVYYNDALVYKEVQDNDVNDKDEKIGVLVLDNLIDGIEYKVDYKGIGVETTITQDDINGEIDKLYVLNGYTFISFVPLGTSQRPEDSSLTYDVNGIAFYDKTDYFSGNNRQSFVIDNASGYVYQIKDVSIDEIKNNLILISGKIYDMRVTENDELEFYTVVKNETLTVSHFYKDIYGNKYIQNDYLDVVDEENLTIYYTENKKTHLFSNEGVAFKEYTEIIRDYSGNYIRTDRKYYKVVKDFAEVAIGKDENYTFGSKTDYSSPSYGVIEDGYYYLISSDSAFRVNLESFESETVPTPFYYTGYNGFYFDHKTVVTYHYAKYGDTVYNLYFAELYGENALPHGDDFYYNHDLDMGSFATKLLEDVKIETTGNILSFKGWKFRKTTLTETVFYQVIVGEDGRPEIVSENYVAPEEHTITLQPLNK